MQRIGKLAPAVLLVALAAGCGKQPPATPAAAPAPSAFPGAASPPTPPPPPVPPPSPVFGNETPVTSAPIPSLNDRTIDDINGPNSPLKPVFFAYDSDEIDEEAKRALASNADLLKSYPTWIVTIEGHCDERGTAEYNLALGERRALAARSYLVSIGIPADRIRTVSYGKEFPFDQGHDEPAWTMNRRAHFMLTSK
jgi:peptidoglycan-associated lipoprotein